MTDAYETGRFAAVPPGAVARVESADDVAEVIGRMLADLRAHPGAWENHTLESFLAATQESVTSLPWVYRDRDEEFPPEPGWRQFAEVLVMASGLE
ncbi:DUF7660 family protein [Actinoplanes aureus]|jgi:hypothetical protein|uniref:DUF7660 domain-containing protein n=1 Tax=Actinoplanes aureus TaxID=2792083 RepID=A0A931CCI6_9ACTN|nr:hypothetical protein [Actinoplanes aureus]MBG0562390.1 hypothetical protein [Actinoplanes aureus]